MKKILIIGCGLMFSALSAMTLPDHVQVVNHEKLTYQAPQELFDCQLVLADDFVVSEFVVQPQKTVQLQTFSYVHDFDVVDRKGFVKPILYENATQFVPLSYSNIYKAKVPVWNEVLYSNRIRDMSKTLVS